MKKALFITLALFMTLAFAGLTFAADTKAKEGSTVEKVLKSGDAKKLEKKDVKFKKPAVKQKKAAPAKEKAKTSKLASKVKKALKDEVALLKKKDFAV